MIISSKTFKSINSDNIFFPFGNYVLLEHLASGGWADIYRAGKCSPDGMPSFYAIKMLCNDMSEDRIIRDMFAEEAQIQAMLHHENIVRFEEFVKIGGQLGIVMDYYHGRNLSHIINGVIEAGLSIEQDIAFYVMHAAIKALEYVHGMSSINGIPLQIVHRDINPTNIFLCFNGDVKIIDFGIAQRRFESRCASKKDIYGKLSYMSPEQVSREDVDRQTDIFALGAVFYEILSGKPLFPGERHSAIVKSLKTVDIIETVSSLQVDDQLRDILKRLLARNRLKRYRNLSDTRKQLITYGRQKKYSLSSSKLRKLMGHLFPVAKRDEIKKIEYYEQKVVSAGINGKF